MHRPEGLCQASDQELVQRIGEGCEESFRVFFRRWAPALERFLRRSTGSRETSEDLLQEAFIRVLRAAPRFEARGSVAAWVYRIGANLARSHWRHEYASPVRRPDGRPAWTGGNGTEEAPAATPESLQRRRAMERAAAAALERCSENQRLVFLLKVDQELTYEEIATVLKCPVGTVKSRFHFAVQRLRRDLRDWADSPRSPAERTS